MVGIHGIQHSKNGVPCLQITVIGNWMNTIARAWWRCICICWGVGGGEASSPTRWNSATV